MTVADVPAPRVLHVITGLGVGGAEMMLYKLLSAIPDAPERMTVISLTDDGPAGRRIHGLGVPMRVLRLKPGLSAASTVFRLSRWIRKARPDVVQTWMYHADLIGGLTAKLADRQLPVIWNIRASNLEPTCIKLNTRLIARLCGRLSGSVPSRIVSCSHSAVCIHAALGYRSDRMLVIPNGFDLDRFHPDPEARSAIRAELDIPTDAVVIGLVARFHPMKNHRGFVMAARRLATTIEDCYFLLCGSEVTWKNPELAAWIDQAGLRPRFRLLGERSDITRISATLDIASLSSFAAEGFSNVLGEAMACGVPCVATDVGDCAYIVGETGRIVAPGDDAALATAWLEVCRLGRQGRRELGERALRRVQEYFGLAAVVERYNALYRQVHAEAVR